MGLDSIFLNLNLSLEVFFIDLILSGDNALIIAVACRSLPPRQKRLVMIFGTTGAIALRCVLTSIASMLLTIPLLKLLGGVALAVIAVKLITEKSSPGTRLDQPADSRASLGAAVSTILVADVTMSIDHVIGLAAITQGSTFYLVLGLLMSVPLMMFGSLFVTDLLDRYPLLIRGCAALLGWVAGDIAIADPLVKDWVYVQSPALTIVVPVLIAVFVLLEARIIEKVKAAGMDSSPSSPAGCVTQELLSPSADR